MKKNNVIFKLMWVGGIYLFLVLILVLVIDYKVKWEGRDLSKYLYFYDCSGNLCTTELKISNYYSRYKCVDFCPRVRNVLDNNIVILEGVKSGAIFNYKEGKVLNDKYVNYVSLDKNRILVSNGTKKGIIDLSNKVILPCEYDDISTSISGNYIGVKKGDLWGLKSLSSDKEVVYQYEDFYIIKDNNLLVSLNNKYYFVNFEGLRLADTEYDYLYYIDKYILAVANKKIDILDSDLHDRLVMKIDTTYNYTNSDERRSLNITSDLGYIYFTVYTKDGYVQYKYDKEKNTIGH